MYEIKVRSNFSSAHNLRNYRGKCEHLHGHNWVVEAIFVYDALDQDGLAIDFKYAKAILNKVLEGLDHAYINDIHYFKTVNPTSENIAKFIYDNIKKASKNIKRVSVWENENSAATYME